MIKPLVCFCVDFLLKSLNAENVFTVLQFCIDCETDKRLMEGCKEILRTKTRDVLKGESFSKISHKCLIFLLEDDSLDVAEIHLFRAVSFPLYDKLKRCNFALTRINFRVHFLLTL